MMTTSSTLPQGALPKHMPDGFISAIHRMNAWFDSRFLSEKITLLVCHFNAAYFSASLYDSTPCFRHAAFHEPKHIQSAALKRRAEFFVGRFLAAQALKELGSGSLVLPIGDHRNPVWPSGYIGSITHTKQTAMVAVGLSGDIALLGIDCECIMQKKTAEKLVNRASSAVELAHCMPHFCLEVSMTLIFSAKEAVFKAIYPVLGRYVGFDAAEITAVSIDSSDSLAHASLPNVASQTQIGRLKIALHLSEPALNLPSHLTGWFEVCKKRVVVMICEPIHTTGDQLSY